MSFDPIRINLELPGVGETFAIAAQAALAPVVRPLPPFRADPASVENGLAALPAPPAECVIEPTSLPAARVSAVFATPFCGGARRWVSHAAFPHPRLGLVLVGVAELSLYVDAGVATVSLSLGLGGWPMTDVTLGTEGGEEILLPAPGRADATGDLALCADALGALDAAFAGTAGRGWVFDYTARVAAEDYHRLEALRTRLNGRA